MDEAEAFDALSGTEITRLIIRLRQRLAEAERRIDHDPDEAGAVATMLITLRKLAATQPAIAPKLEALIARYAPLAERAN